MLCIDTDSQHIVDGLTKLVGDSGVRTGDDAAPYAKGARYGAGIALCVVRPASADQVSEVVKFCVAQAVHIVVQGANTGLVGSSSPDATGRQVILSTDRLNNVCAIDIGNRTATVDAGVSLQELNDSLEPHSFWFPVDLGANPMIGGMVSANTGGTRLIRYGDVRHNLLSLEVVLFDPPGEILTLGRPLRKDNTGFDLKQLFVGTSGVGGVITRATLEIHPLPQQSATALVVPTSDGAVMQLLAALESELGDFLAAFEGMSANAMQVAVDHIPNLRNPFAPEPMPDFAILIELESSCSSASTGLNLAEILNRFLEDKFESMISNAVIGSGKDLWRLRHSISEGARSVGKPIAFDVSVPRASIMAFRKVATDIVAKNFPFLTVIDFGHIADGGVHFNLVWPHSAARAFDAAVVNGLRDQIYAVVVEQFNGSFSAEHGVGPHNASYYQRYTDGSVKRIAGAIKHTLDPQGLCGNVNYSA